MTAAAKGNAIRVAVVGCGEFGRNHARVYREIERATLAGVFDADGSRAAKFAKEFNTRVFPSLEALRDQIGRDIEAARALF